MGILVALPIAAAIAILDKRKMGTLVPVTVNKV